MCRLEGWRKYEVWTWLLLRMNLCDCQRALTQMVVEVTGILLLTGSEAAGNSWIL